MLDPRANRGYVKQGRERVTNSTDLEEIAELRRTAPDVKESMEIGLETGLPSTLVNSPASLAQRVSQILNFGIIGHPLRRPQNFGRQ